MLGLKFASVIKKVFLASIFIIVFGFNLAYAHSQSRSLNASSEIVYSHSKLPKGNYSSSCSGCSFNQKSNQLSCVCKVSGSYQSYRSNTVINPATCRYVSNDNGFLTCHSKDLGPAGGYVKSCSGCHWDSKKSVLQCDCDYTVKRTRHNLLKVPKNCSQVDNINGHLVCTDPLNLSNMAYFWDNSKSSYKYVSPGFIYNNYRAKGMCEHACPKGYVWNKQWRTVKLGHSVCECAPEKH